MTAKEFQNRMDSEINKRLTSSEWDFDIASRVILKRGKMIKRNLYTMSSFSLLATAAVIIFVFFINISSVKTNNINDIDLFISNQIDGTHGEVFEESYSNNLIYVNANSNANDPIDNLIEASLSMR